MKKAILYINQFFGQIGGEDMAHIEPQFNDKGIGPALAFQAAFGDEVAITHTIVCGDNYMGSNTDQAIATIVEFLEDKEFDLFLAGPAFRAGRYGVACGHICKAVQEKFKVPAITSMDEENPGVEMFRKEMYIFKGGASAKDMKKDVEAVTNFAKLLLSGKPLPTALEAGYYSRGVRKQIWLDPPVAASDRVIAMLLSKVYGESYGTELPIPKTESVPIADAIAGEELRKMEVALITSGGIVPMGNPDRIQSASATKWGKYDISQMERLKGGEFMTIHAGYDPAANNEDPNRTVPVDVMKEFTKEGKIGGVFKYFYSTVGTGTTQAEAARMGREIASELLKNGIRAAILTST
jgi:glycine reductase